MVNFRNESDCRRAERIISGEVDVEEKDSALVETALRADHCCLPMKLIIISGPSINIFYRVIADILQFLLQPPLSHYAIILVLSY